MFVEIGEELWNLNAIARVIPYVGSQWVVILIWGEKIILNDAKGRLIKSQILRSRGVEADASPKETDPVTKDFWATYCEVMNRYGEYRV